MHRSVFHSLHNRTRLLIISINHTDISLLSASYVLDVVGLMPNAIYSNSLGCPQPLQN